MKVCLIDSRVKESNIFLTSVQDDVTAILLDYETDTFDTLLLKIGSATSIAYVAYASFDQTYSFFKDSSFDMESKASWQPFFNFLSGINGLQYFDFLGCSLASDARWKEAFVWMEETGVNIRASTDETGNIASGGNWILEDGSVDAKELYFKEGIGIYWIIDVIDNNLYYNGKKVTSGGYIAYNNILYYNGEKVNNKYIIHNNILYEYGVRTTGFLYKVTESILIV